MSGLSAWIGDQFKQFAGFSPLFMSLIVLLVVGFNTEIMSNPASAQLFVPILRDMVGYLLFHSRLVTQRIKPWGALLLRDMVGYFVFHSRLVTQRIKP